MATATYCFIVHNSCVDTYALRERVGVRGYECSSYFVLVPKQHNRATFLVR